LYSQAPRSTHERLVSILTEQKPAEVMAKSMALVLTLSLFLSMHMEGVQATHCPSSGCPADDTDDVELIQKRVAVEAPLEKEGAMNETCPSPLHLSIRTSSWGYENSWSIAGCYLSGAGRPCAGGGSPRYGDHRTYYASCCCPGKTVVELTWHDACSYGDGKHGGFTHSKGLQLLAKREGEVHGTCPGVSFKWNLSPYNTDNRPSTTTTSTFYFQVRDCKRYLTWPGRADDLCRTIPRVLMFTWCTENVFEEFQKEMYWKACYAHTHGYDLLMGDPLNASLGGRWYNRNNMWAWWTVMMDVLPKYDYVFFTGADVLISQYWLNFPVWAFSGGQDDLSLMDQCYADWGLNENAVLFKNTKWSMEWLRKGVESFMHLDTLQGDNGAYNEQLLVALGAEAEARGETGYNNDCLDHLVVPRLSSDYRKTPLYLESNQNYSHCFFDVLERLAGPLNLRNLPKHIRFNPLMPASDNNSDVAVPWANCWSLLRDPWYARPCVGARDPELNCFTWHFNGMQKLKENHRYLEGVCPDPTFDWSTFQYNPKNRQRQ